MAGAVYLWVGILGIVAVLAWVARKERQDAAE